jgi:hypothetical protein
MAQGPGWWIASDGKWYPPEQHPDRAQPVFTDGPESLDQPVVADEPVVADQPVVAESEHTAAQSAPASRWLAPTASTSPGPPGAEGSGDSAEASSEESGPAATVGDTTATLGDTIVTVGDTIGGAPPPTPVPDSPAPRDRPLSRKLWVVCGSVVAILAAVALVVALTAKATGTALAPGAATATIHVTLRGSGQDTFSGTLAGRSLTGTISNSQSPLTGTGSGSATINGAYVTYKGNLGGQPYVIHVSLHLPSATQVAPTGQITFTVSGTYGAEAVTGSALFELLPSSNTAKSLTVPFNGSVGTQTIVGSATATQDGPQGIDVTARLSILPSSP